MKSGIYIIKNEENKKVYIGQSKDLNRRLNNHRRLLIDGKHPNVYMQRSFNNADGNFSFEILEECPIDMLDEREIFWISYYNSDKRDYGYNIQSGGHLGHHWNLEARQRRSGAGNPMYGHKMSPAHIERIRTINRAHSDKLTVDDVKNIKRSLYDEIFTMKELSEIYDVGFTTISKIKNCNNWEWVLPELNHKLKNMRKDSLETLRRSIIDLHNLGKSTEEIYNVLPCGKNFIYKVLNEEFKDEQISDKIILIQNVRQAVQDGLTDKEIKNKYHVCSSTIAEYAKDIKAERRRIQEQERIALSEKIESMRADGMLVKDIAAELGLHRTTVTEYCKRNHGNTESA